MANVKKLAFKDDSLKSLPDGQTATAVIVETEKDGDTTKGVVEVTVQFTIIKAEKIS